MPKKESTSKTSALASKSPSGEKKKATAKGAKPAAAAAKKGQSARKSK
jgi:hypothetical protein